MYDQHCAVIEIGQNIFTAPLEPLEAPAGHARGEILWQRDAQGLAACLGLNNTFADYSAFQAAPDRFYFR